MSNSWGFDVGVLEAGGYGGLPQVPSFSPPTFDGYLVTPPVTWITTDGWRYYIPGLFGRHRQRVELPRILSPGIIRRRGPNHHRTLMAKSLTSLIGPVAAVIRIPFTTVSAYNDPIVGFDADPDYRRLGL